MRIYNLPKCSKCDLRFDCPMHYNMFELRDISKKFALYSIVRATTAKNALDAGNKCRYCMYMVVNFDKMSRKGNITSLDNNHEVIIMNVMIEALKGAHRDAIDGAIFESQERLKHARI